MTTPASKHENEFLDSMHGGRLTTQQGQAVKFQESYSDPEVFKGFPGKAAEVR